MTFKMDIRELQKRAKEVTDLIDTKRKGRHDSDTTIMHIYEELGEISSQLYNKKIGRAEFDKENLAEEIVDCLILLLHLSKVYDLDIEKEIRKKLEKLKQRHNDLNWNGIEV